MKFKNIMLTEWSQTWKSAVFWFHLCEDQTSKTGNLQLPVMDLKRAHRHSLGFWHVLYLFLRLLIYLIFFWLHWVFIAASRLSLVVVRASLVAQTVKCLPAMQETWVQFLGREDLLKGEATHSGILGLLLWLSWQRIHLQCGRPGFDRWVRKIPWRRVRLPTPVFWPGEFHRL